jgi:hypothetical protein
MPGGGMETRPRGRYPLARAAAGDPPLTLPPPAWPLPLGGGGGEGQGEQQ